MIDCNVILYSRTITNGYRWIYIDKTIDDDIYRLIVADTIEYSDLFKSDNLFIRTTDESVIIYMLFNSNNTDKDNRIIRCVCGFSFKKIDYITIKDKYEFINSLKKSIINYDLYTLEKIENESIVVQIDSKSELVNPLVSKLKELNDIFDYSKIILFYNNGEVSLTYNENEKEEVEVVESTDTMALLLNKVSKLSDDICALREIVEKHILTNFENTKANKDTLMNILLEIVKMVSIIENNNHKKKKKLFF